MANERQLQLLRASIEDILTRPDSSSWELGALRAGVVRNDPDLIALFEEMTAPEQATVTVKLTGATIVDHAASAHHFGPFIARFADAVKAIVRGDEHRRPIGDCVLVDAISPGSVEVTLRAAASAEKKRRSGSAKSKTGDLVETVPAFKDETVGLASAAMRSVVTILGQADQDNLDDTTALDGEVERLPEPARKELKGLARQVKEAGWKVASTTRQRGRRVEHQSFSSRGAGALIESINRTEPEREPFEFLGKIDGFRQSQNCVYLVSVDEKVKHRINVVDDDLYVQTSKLYAEHPDHLVKSVIKVEALPRKGHEDDLVHRFVLASIELADHQGELLGDEELR